MNDFIKETMLKNEKNLNKFATKDKDAIRLKQQNKDLRPEYFKDIDKIIYSNSYVRYMDKTQVFPYKINDHISKRMTHVQMVSKIARTIGRALNLNEDLIEAIALGHDLGHVPFGHLGEEFLNELSLENNEGIFMHNVQSVRNLMNIENNGQGLNITIQVLDGILCHNGEIVIDKYQNVKKTTNQFLQEYENCYKSIDHINNLKPMTLEGCVVRISDVISYIGKDLEEAMNLNIVKDELPQNVKQILGNKNSEIIDTIIVNIINNSYNKPYITMSKEVNDAIEQLKNYNYENIYYKIITPELKQKYKEMFKTVFYENLKYLENNLKETNIYKVYLNDMCEKYKLENTNARIVIDYISGMTDDYFIKEYNKIIEKNDN